MRYSGSIICCAINGANEPRPRTLEHPFYKYANLTNELSVSQANQLWVSDITYIRTGRDFSYLSLITDAYSHKIVGWALDTTLQTKGQLAALQMAIKTLPKGKEGLIHIRIGVSNTAAKNIFNFSAPVTSALV